MGCCFGSPSDESSSQSAREPAQPSPETRRRQCLEAAEKRRSEQQSKGFQDPMAFERANRKAEELERLERQQIMAGNQGGGGLKWTVG